MWSNVISIDKRYEKEISYILNRVESTNELSYATEESPSRLFVYLASACENADAAEEKLRDIACTVVLDFFKLRYFTERLPMGNIDLAKCALASAMVHFDRDFERAVLEKAFIWASDYNVDGVFNFRLAALRDSWDELAEVASRLMDGASTDGELYDVAAFILGSDGGKNQLLIDGGGLKNITCRKTVEVIDLFDKHEYNLFSAVLGERPREILVRRGALPTDLCSGLKRIARVIEK